MLHTHDPENPHKTRTLQVSVSPAGFVPKRVHRFDKSPYGCTMVVNTIRTMSDTSAQPCSTTSTEKGPSRRGARFYLIFLSICISLFLPAFDLTGLTTALPTIIRDLNGQDFAWVGSAYALSSTALLPMCGGLAEVLILFIVLHPVYLSFIQIFGRRMAMIIALLFFAFGSALCGAAQSMEWLIAARGAS